LVGVNLLALASMGFLLSGSEAAVQSVVGAYDLISVNGQNLPAVVWTSEENDKHCEYKSSGGAVILTLDGRAAAYSLERINCAHTDGSTSSDLQPFLMFTGNYKVSGDQIMLFEEDKAFLDGDLLVLTVTGILKFEGQTAEFVFRKI
jgi:glyoxylate utilization-related uncharacterized protein